jgi:hypothetical protein
MSDPDPFKQAWQASAANPALPNIGAVQADADRFYRTIRRRNRREHAGSRFAVVVCAVLMFLIPYPSARIGVAMTMIGIFISAWQFHLRAPATPPPDQGAPEPILIHHRAQLERQRKVVASIFTWGLLPALPGIVVIMFSMVLDGRVAGPLQLPRLVWIACAFVAIVFFGIWLLNQYAARHLQKQIDEIDLLIGGRE